MAKLGAVVALPISTGASLAAGRLLPLAQTLGGSSRAAKSLGCRTAMVASAGAMRPPAVFTEADDCLQRLA